MASILPLIIGTIVLGFGIFAYKNAEKSVKHNEFFILGLSGIMFSSLDKKVRIKIAKVICISYALLGFLIILAGWFLF